MDAYNRMFSIYIYCFFHTLLCIVYDLELGVGSSVHLKGGKAQPDGRVEYVKISDQR